MQTLVPGQSGIPLDLYIKAGTTLFDPTPLPSFSITDANSAFQGSGYGYRLSIGHYDARNFIVTTSGALGTWGITWNVGGASKIETFTVEQPTLSEVGEKINEIQKLRDHIRIDMGDFNADIFNDTQLNIYLDKAVKRLNRELGISYKVRPTGITPGGIGQPAITPPITIDIDAGTMFPNNDEIKDLIVLQTEVMIARAEISVLSRASSVGAVGPLTTLMTATSGIVSDNGEGLSVKNTDGVMINTSARMHAWLSNKTKLFLENAAAREKELQTAILRIRTDIAMATSKVIY